MYGTIRQTLNPEREREKLNYRRRWLHTHTFRALKCGSWEDNLKIFKRF